MGAFTGAAMLPPSLPPAREVLADRGYDADWFRSALIIKDVTPCIPCKKNLKVPIDYDKALEPNS